MIFLSQAEKNSWIGDVEHGTVIHNFVVFKKFNYAKSGGVVVEKLGLNDQTKVILYVGGSKSHKGVIELLKVLIDLKTSYGNNFVCLMPDSEVKNKDHPSRIEQEMIRIIKEGDLEENCRLLPFDPDIVDLFAISDVLVFPATKPHFARPIIEASAMGKPAIAFDLKAIDELIKDEETGYLVPVRDKERLLEKIKFLLENPDVAKQMGRAGRKFALEKFGQKGQMKKILALYERALGV